MVKRSDPIRKQFVPHIDELDNTGLISDPFEPGRNYKGIYGLERVYKDRIVLTPHFDCSAYCRYCFKKTRTLAGSAEVMSQENMDDALHVIQSDEDLRVALITGGDPFRDEYRLFYLLQRISKIPHIDEIRIGTRNILFEPQKVTQDFADQLAAFQFIDPDDLSRSRSLAIALSINHVDELSPKVIKAVRRLINAGIGVRGQVTLLKGVNDSVTALKTLYEAFAQIGINAYYLLHCMPVLGAGHFRTSISKGQEILRDLSHLSGVLAPTYVCVSKVGKLRIGLDSPLQTEVISGRKFLQRVTPYKTDDFLRYSGNTQLPALYHTDESGFIVAHYLDGNDD